MNDFTLQKSFDAHSVNYGQRVKDRAKYANLTLEDKLIVSFLKRNLSQESPCTILDAACGTGDRLRMLFDVFGLSRELFEQVIGFDYAPGMLKIAGSQRLTNGKILYQSLTENDIVKDLSSVSMAGVILCLWEVTNSLGLDSFKALKNLASHLTPNGYLIYDMITTKASPVLKRLEAQILVDSPELTKSRDPQRVWYRRDDGSVGYLRMFSPPEVTELLAVAELHTCELWAYRHGELKPHSINIHNDHIDESKIEDFTGLVVIQQKT